MRSDGPVVKIIRYGSLPVLIVVLVATLLLAAANAHQEFADAPDDMRGVTMYFVFLLAAIAGVNQIPGLVVSLCVFCVPVRRLWLAFLLLAPAWITAATGLLVYAAYAATGTSDSMESAGHMHVITLPVMHTAFAGALYFVFGVVAMCLAVAIPPRARVSLR